MENWVHDLYDRRHRFIDEASEIDVVYVVDVVGVVVGPSDEDKFLLPVGARTGRRGTAVREGTESSTKASGLDIVDVVVVIGVVIGLSD